MIIDSDAPKKKKEQRDEHVKLKHERKKGKGKSRATDADSEFRVVGASLVVSIAPVFANNLRGGAEEMLDSMVMRYIPAFRGVMLAHSNLHFLNKTATINADCPFSVCTVGFNATVWSPHVSMKLGEVNLCSPDHVSLLVHRTFNVSIPKHHLPDDQWEFEYGPAENDPTFGAGAHHDLDTAESANTEHNQTKGDAENAGHDPIQSSAEDNEHGDEGSGRWVHKLTGTKLGGQDGYLEFIVIGLTVANEMLSLQGSIQPDPFSPKHVPRAMVAARSPEPPAQTPTRDLPELGHEDDEDGEEDEDIDTFAQLAQLADQEEQKAKKQKKAEAEEAEREKREKKEKKRKRKEARAEEAEREKGEGEGEKKAKRKKTAG
ncbi:hypothetical protein BV22DRAFT_1010160 [Leucogyrophana mollusca]|uniref:Uncharacterized protein n=1 Tax=Leucogyrophana mollusca TaxID=85980 RepID=A0ACB8BK42_9AGAM|nr:hypothetical protein BV22DRAFT_1010160 [Leucogyrophana mollusca]